MPLRLGERIPVNFSIIYYYFRSKSVFPENSMNFDAVDISMLYATLNKAVNKTLETTIIFRITSSADCIQFINKLIRLIH